MPTSITGQGISVYPAPDDALSSTSKNPVQNKVIDEEFSDFNRQLSEQSEVVNRTVGNDAFIYKKTNVIPSYYFASPENPNSFLDQEYLEQKIASIPVGKHLIFITDVHWATNQQKSTQLLEYVRLRTGIKDVFCGGDILNFENNKYLASEAYALYINEVASAVGNNIFVAVGDHDNNTANYSGDDFSSVMLPFSVIEKWITTPIKNKIVQDSDASINARLDRIAGLSSDERAELFNLMKINYYYDDSTQKIRYIVLNSGFANSGVVNTVFNKKSTEILALQMPWYVNALHTAPKGYDIVVISHNAMDYYTDQVAYTSTACQRMCRAASARKGNTSITFNYPSGNENFNAAFPDVVGQVTYNFSADSIVNNILVLCGDNHVNLDAIATTATTLKIYEGRTILNGDILAVSTQCDNSHQHNIYIANDSQGESSRMIDATITEQAFDVVTISENNMITFTRFGAGLDRQYNMAVG